MESATRLERSRTFCTLGALGSVGAHRSTQVLAIMYPKAKQYFSVALGFALIGVTLWAVYILLRGVWRSLVDLNPELAVGLIMAGATILAATMTVMLGRYFERKKDIEAHFRAEKIKIYDEFLVEFFNVMHTAGNSENLDHDNESPEKLVQFLREWQRKLVIWGGDNVLQTYFIWMNKLKAGNPDANTVFLMDNFFRALRADIGQSSSKIPKGAFANLILRHGDYFLAQAELDPNITLAKLAELEKDKFGE